MVRERLRHCLLVHRPDVPPSTPRAEFAEEHVAALILVDLVEVILRFRAADPELHFGHAFEECLEAEPVAGAAALHALKLRPALVKVRHVRQEQPELPPPNHAGAAHVGGVEGLCHGSVIAELRPEHSAGAFGFGPA